MPKLNSSLKYLRRPARWGRRTRWLLGQMLLDIGLGPPTGPGETPGGPVWRRDNLFLAKAGRTETRRFGLSLRLLVTVLTLGGLLLGGLWLDGAYPRAVGQVLRFVFGTSFPTALLLLLLFVHVLLITSARTALTVSLADEARRGTLPDLLLSPLRRAEMLLAMGAGPARTAFTVALAGLPLYALLAQIGALSLWEIACLYVLFALLCYQPPIYGFPALSGAAQTPDAPAGQFQPLRASRAARRTGPLSVGFPLLLGLLFAGQVLGLLGTGWLVHLLAALHLRLVPGLSFFLFFAWPYYALQLLSGRPDFFHLALSPLWYVLPLLTLHRVSSALMSAAALSAGDFAEMRRLPISTRAQTLARWTARAAGLCALAVVWKAWVESGDTATLAGSPGSFHAGPAWEAAGLLLLLGGLSLPAVCGRALGLEIPARRPAGLVLRRAFKRSLRPLGVAGGMFLFACALGGLSPFALPVCRTAGEIALAGIVTVVWAAGLRRVLSRAGKWTAPALLYALPLLALSLPALSAFLSPLSLLAALSPVPAWVRLFAGGPGLVARFPFWTLAPLPPLSLCLGGPLLTGAVLLAAAALPRKTTGTEITGTETISSRSALRAPARYEARTQALMAWVTARTDNPLLIYEVRTRTRSGRWFSAGISGAVALALAVAVALAYPDIVAILSSVSPFHFFGGGFGSFFSKGSVWADLAALLLTAQCYLLCFRGQLVGETLIARDRQGGTWGLLLITLLTTREIFWGKVLGQTAAVGTLWSALSLAALLLYGLAAPAVGVVPALAAWGTGQVFVAAVFTLGVGLGTALATFPLVLKSLRGISTLLLACLIGLGVYGQYRLLPFDLSGGWALLAERLLLGSVYALTLAALLFVFAERRLSAQRRRDIALGDGPQ